jgi:hypothetical protein
MLAKTLRIMAVLFSVAAYAVVNVRVGSEHCEITVNMNRPLWIELPCQILPVGTDGTRGLWIAPKSGRGWKGEAGGLARYRFWAPRSGKYTVWGYCYWNDACTNAVFVKVDQMARAILGNDPIFAEWHWIRGFDLYLEQGPHLLELSNHSDGIAVLRVLLTTDDLKTPEGAGSVSADLFYDDFNGCDNGNFARWRTIRGQWSVLHCGDKTKPEENFLQGRADTDALLVFDSQSWSGYRFNVLIGPVQGEQPQSAAGVCFGLQSPDNYYRLQWARAGAIPAAARGWQFDRRSGVVCQRLGRQPVARHRDGCARTAGHDPRRRG